MIQSPVRTEIDSTHQTKKGVIVLLYHRVADLQADPQALAVHPDCFAEHLEHIAAHHQVLPLSQLVSAVTSGEPIESQVAITFDDGYADNLEIALPILERFEMPATVFVTPQCDESPREFWWDELERIVLLSPELPPRCSLSLEGCTHHWDLEDAQDWSVAKASGTSNWNVLRSAPPTPRQALYLFLCRLIRPLPYLDRERAIADLAAWAGASRTPRPTHRRLSTSDLRRLAGSPLIEIGGHTATHPQLSALSAADQYDEIITGKQKLEAALGKPIRAFSYPYGTRTDFTQRTVELVQQAGFSYACANTGRPPDPRAKLSQRVDSYRLPRSIVRDWSAVEFSQRLESVWHEVAGTA